MFARPRRHRLGRCSGRWRAMLPSVSLPAVAVGIRIGHLADADAVEDDPDYAAEGHGYILALWGGRS